MLSAMPGPAGAMLGITIPGMKAGFVDPEHGPTGTATSRRWFKEWMNCQGMLQEEWTAQVMEPSHRMVWFTSLGTTR